MTHKVASKAVFNTQPGVGHEGRAFFSRLPKLEGNRILSIKLDHVIPKIWVHDHVAKCDDYDGKLQLGVLFT